jgi:pantoate--beta-alanine ligase
MLATLAAQDLNMTLRPKIVRTLSALHAAREGFGKASVALVPTMGALHAGHIALVKAARERARRVVVSIFINPTQFAPTEDLGNYPRTWKADVAALAKLNVDLIWAPTPQVMYPDGFATRIDPAGAAKAGLEDKFRPHFFGGVATVVCKLFTQVTPDYAMFGEKDYQQLRVVTQMARDLDLSPRIIGLKTVRERDGLALSSRNVYLNEAERAAAPTLYRVLRASAKLIKAGDPVRAVLKAGREEIEQSGFVLDYLEARQALSLAPITSRKDGPMRLMVAAKIGKTRLIDNIAV